jgi:hypothetical protein
VNDCVSEKLDVDNEEDLKSEELEGFDASDE